MHTQKRLMYPCQNMHCFIAKVFLTGILENNVINSHIRVVGACKEISIALLLSLLTVVGTFQWACNRMRVNVNEVLDMTAIEISATRNLFKWCLPRFWTHLNRAKDGKSSEHIVLHFSKLLNDVAINCLYCVKKKCWRIPMQSRELLLCTQTYFG